MVDRTISRRDFLKVGAALAAAGVVAPRILVGQSVAEPAASPKTAPARPEAARKTILSFYCDDTSPYTAGAKAFETFLDYCAEQKLAGESSAILGMGGHSMVRDPSAEEKAFLKQVARAWDCGVGTQMELMTHGGLFDFEANRAPEGVIHEGLWLHEPAVTQAEYERYLRSILAEGERAGIRFTGLTWPGCSCEACTRRYAELNAHGRAAPNPALWKALLALAEEGKFRGPTVPCFFGSDERRGAIHPKAESPSCGVYDLMPNAGDNFGIWENDPSHVNPDYYVTADGKSGVIVRHVQEGAPYAIWYSHWQGLNPAKGVGWKAFTTVIERIKQFLGDRVVWMRPSEITDRYHKAGGWGFLDGL